MIGRDLRESSLEGHRRSTHVEEHLHHRDVGLVSLKQSPGAVKLAYDAGQVAYCVG